MNQAKWSTFYSKVPQKISDTSLVLQKVLESGDVDVNDVMSLYFKTYWKDFREFWAQSGEKIDWVTFALAPHNGNFFTTWVFYYHSDLLKIVQKDLLTSGWVDEDGKFLEAKT